MSDSLLLVMYKPNGYARVCTAAEVNTVLSAWNSVLLWLRGADPERLPESHHVAHVASKAYLRTSRFPDYDICTWSECAVGVPLMPQRDAGVSLPEFGHDLYIGLGLQRLRTSCCWLNRVAIEMLYGRTPAFREHRELLVPRLLEGPVQMESWTGPRIPLAHATKFLLRHVLSAEKVTNLVHLSRLTSSEAAAVEAACEVGGLDDEPVHDTDRVGIMHGCAHALRV